MKYWASVRVQFDYYTEDIEAEDFDEAKSKAYDAAKALMNVHDEKLRPFGVSVIVVGEVKE